MDVPRAIEARVARRPLDIRLFGPVRARTRAGRVAELGGPKGKVVLVRLALRAGEVVPTDDIVDTLWGDAPPPTARRSAQAHVAKLRAALGGDDGPIRSQPPGYVLDVPRECVDALRVEDQLQAARELLATDPFEAGELIAACRADVTDRPLADLDGSETLVAERERLARLQDELDDTELELRVALDDPATSILRLERAVADKPTHEPHWIRLIKTYYASGRQQDALEAYRRAQHTLREQLGLEPSPQLRDLELHILRQDDHTDHVDDCPYQGLVSYQIADGHRFFGRRATIDDIVRLVTSAPLTAVVGSSGVGKSSVLRAGLGHRVIAGQVPGIRDLRVITPGPHPFRSLFDDSRSVDLLVVDQFEELFTLTDDPCRRAEFVDELAALAEDGRTRVVISVRADFYADCLQLPALVPVLGGHQLVVGALSDIGVREAVLGPARAADLEVEPALLDVLIDEVADRPGALPLLSHALRETWRRRSGSTLTLQAYRKAGAIAGSIAVTAERLYDGLDHERREQMQRLFGRLVEPGTGRNDARRAVPRSELLESGIDERLVDRLVGARLLTATSDHLEISHEALITAWPRLADWVDAERDNTVVQQRLARAATAWFDDGKQDADLYRGHRLDAALAWRKDTDPLLLPVEEEFLRTSEARLVAEKRRRRRTIRRLRVLTGVSLVAMTAAVVAAGVAVDRGSAAAQRRREAEIDRAATTIAIDTSLSVADQLTAALALAAETPTEAVRRLLFDRLIRIPAVSATSRVDLIYIAGQAPASATGGAVLVDDEHARPAVFDPASLELEHLEFGIEVEAVVRRPTGLVGVLADSYRVEDLSTGQFLGPPPVLRGEPSAVALSLDGTTLALGYDAPRASEADVGTLPGAADVPLAVVDVIDVTSGGRSIHVVGAATIRGLEFTADGTRLMAGVGHDAIEVWDVGTGGSILTTRDDPVGMSSVTTTAFDRTGRSIAVGHDDGEITIWRESSATTGGWRRIPVVGRHEAAITWLEFDAGGETLVSSSRDGSVVVWDAVDGSRLRGPFEFDATGVVGSIFVGDSAEVNTFDSRGRIWHWDSADVGPLVAVQEVASAAAPPRSSNWLAAADDALVAVSGATVTPLPSDTPVRGVINGWTGDHAVVHDDRIEWFREDGELLLTVPYERIGALALGERFIAYATGDVPDRVFVVDATGATVLQIHVTDRHGRVVQLSIDPSGSDLLYSTARGALVWYSLERFDGAVLLPDGHGHDGHFVAEDVAVAVGTGGVQIIDADGSPPSVEPLGVGRGGRLVAFDGERRLAATTDATGALSLWHVDEARSWGAPVASIASEPPEWLAFDGPDRLLVGGQTRTASLDLDVESWQEIGCVFLSMADPLGPGLELSDATGTAVTGVCR